MAYQRWWKTVRDQQGNAVNGASCSVYNGGTGTLALVYDPNSDDASPSNISNPFVTTANGVFGFMAADGEYDVQVSGGSVASQQYRVTLNASTVTYNGAGVVLTGDLASPTGASMVGYLAPYAGSVLRAQEDKNSDSLSAFDFMTTAQIADVQSGAMTLDVAAPLQAAITACGNLGRNLWLPQGYYLVTDAASVGGYCLSITRPITIVGEGFYSAIVPKSTVGSTADTIVIAPSASYMGKFLLTNFTIGNPNTGSRYGNRGVALVTTTAGSNAPKFTMRDMAIYQGTHAGGGLAFEHANNVTNNPNGGMYGGLIENCILQGGVYLNGSGDSNVIQKNIISGSNIGINYSLVSGASCLNIEYNNITATGGALKGDLGPRTVVRHNNIELPSGAGSNSAIVDLNGANGVSYGGCVENNLISGFGSATATTCLRVKNAYGLSIKNNVFLSGVSSLVTAINAVDGSVQGLKIEPNTYNVGSFTPSAYNAGTTYAAGAYVTYNQLNWISLSAGNIGNTPGLVQTYWQLTEGPKILDSGIGTCGVIKPVTLGSSWVPYGAAYSQPYLYKDCSGVVHIHGLIKTGTAAPGTTLFTLPSGFRPDHITYHIVHSNGGAVAGVGSINCYDTTGGGGIVTINTGGNTMFALDGVSFIAAGKADGVSAE